MAIKQHYIHIFIALFGLLLLYLPTYEKLYSTIWQSDEQGHGPLILLIVLFLLWQKKDFLIQSIASKMEELIGVFILFIGLLAYILGHSQNILFLDVASQILVLLGAILFLSGKHALLKLWFPVFFLIFMIPLPGTVVDALTMPMKIAVSNVSELLLHSFGYPVIRDGVILQIGYYKLLVADACAGLHTVFSLEAMGLLYLHLVRRDSFARNVAMGLLILPISFIANTIRVSALVLITFYYGDEVGQGFVHDFAGFVLFGTALIMIILMDTLIQKIESIYKQRKVNAV